MGESNREGPKAKHIYILPVTSPEVSDALGMALRGTGGLDELERTENAQHAERVEMVDGRYDSFISNTTKALKARCRTDCHEKTGDAIALARNIAERDCVDMDVAYGIARERLRDEICPVLGGGQRHYKNVSGVAGWAGDDLKGISSARLERVLNYVEKARKGDKLGKDLWESSDRLSKLIHNYVAEMSTVLDNIYYMAAGHYGVGLAHDGEERRNIEMRLRGNNGDLADHLESFSFSRPMREFKRLRNGLLHESPSFKLHITNDREYRFNMLVDYHDPAHRKEVNMFGYLFGFYDCMLAGAERAVGLIVRDKKILRP